MLTMKTTVALGALLLGVLVCVAAPAETGSASVGNAKAQIEGINAEVLGVYFTPPAGAAAAIVQAIDASAHEVLVQAYGFTHNAMAQALVRAHQRGVKVRVLLDKKSQSSNRYVVNVFAQDQIEVRQDGKHAIAHNKVMVIDQELVITGSFNFTNSAETRNAENVLILKSPDLALQYRLQWQNHWAHGAE